MLVTPIAYTHLDTWALEAATDYKPHYQTEYDWEGVFEDPEYDPVLTTAPDELGEFAGRACYESWERPNPKTATNQGYLSNILAQSHESVLEHASVTFYVEGVSRSLLAELTRHRHLSFSVLSQRYVRLDPERIVVPPLFDEYGDTVLVQAIVPPIWGGADWTIRDEFDTAIQLAFESYNAIADKLIAEGVPRKKALEAARSVLPQATESPMVVTGNLRAWRDILGKRYHVAADAEIQGFASEILRNLRILAPHSVQDIPDDPYGTEPNPPAAPEAVADEVPFNPEAA